MGYQNLSIDAQSGSWGGWVETVIYDGAHLRPGDSFPGPALIEETTTTVVARPGDVLRVDDSGDFLVEVAQTDDSLKQHSDALDQWC